jgi:hypothetical protein
MKKTGGRKSRETVSLSNGKWPEYCEQHIIYLSQYIFHLLTLIRKFKRKAILLRLAEPGHFGEVRSGAVTLCGSGSDSYHYSNTEL